MNKLKALEYQLREEQIRINEIQAQINQLKEQAEKLEIEKPNPRWVPGDGEKYYLVTDHGEADYRVWYEYDVDRDRLSIGNVFKTKEEAEFALERLKVIAELKEYASEFVVGSENHYFYYDCKCNTIGYDWVFRMKRNDIYFPYKEIAQQAIAAVGEDRVKKYYLGVKN